MTIRMKCNHCKACGLVLENHDYDMAVKCVRNYGTSLNDLAMEYLRKLWSQKERSVTDVEPNSRQFFLVLVLVEDIMNNFLLELGKRGLIDFKPFKELWKEYYDHKV